MDDLGVLGLFSPPHVRNYGKLTSLLISAGVAPGPRASSRKPVDRVDLEQLAAEIVADQPMMPVGRKGEVRADVCNSRCTPVAHGTGPARGPPRSRPAAHHPPQPRGDSWLAPPCGQGSHRPRPAGAGPRRCPSSPPGPSPRSIQVKLDRPSRWPPPCQAAGHRARRIRSDARARRARSASLEPG